MAPSAAMRCWKTWWCALTAAWIMPTAAKPKTPASPIRCRISTISSSRCPRGHPSKVIFLAADAFGVLPPVSRLTTEQMQYHFLSGFTSKLAGTERGITQPTPTFSACYGAAFLLLHPTQYASVLAAKMAESGAEAWLVNTGWNGEGKRLSLRDTRSIISAILNGTTGPLREETIPVFGLAIPQSIPGVDSAVLDPRNGWSSADKWQEKAESLAQLFMDNFKQYSDTEAGARLALAGPQLQKSAVEA